MITIFLRIGDTTVPLIIFYMSVIPHVGHGVSMLSQSYSMKSLNRSWIKKIGTASQRHAIL